jgi:hypothetical protein
MKIHPIPLVGEGNNFDVMDGGIGKYNPLFVPNQLLRPQAQAPQEEDKQGDN